MLEQANEAINNMDKHEKLALKEIFETEFRNLAAVRDLDPSSEEAQLAIHHFFQYLNDTHGDIYTLEIFRNLGEMYITDNRFTKNIDQFGDGLALFLKKAMKIYAENN